MRVKPYGIVIFVVSTLAAIVVGYLMLNIQDRKQKAKLYSRKVLEVSAQELDPAVWGKNSPYEYDSFIKTKVDYGKTEYGGSTPYNKLERFPAMKRLWAGYAFSIEHTEDWAIITPRKIWLIPNVLRSSANPEPAPTATPQKRPA